MSGPETRPLFVYGSLREPAVRARVLGRQAGIATCPAVLTGHVRELVPSFDYPFIVPAEPEARVEGELLLGLRVEDYRALDHYEDVDDGLYTRAAVTVQTPAGEVEAFAYLRGPNAPGG